MLKTAAETSITLVTILKKKKIPMHGKPDNKPVVDKNGARDVDLRI